MPVLRAPASAEGEESTGWGVFFSFISPKNFSEVARRKSSMDECYLPLAFCFYLEPITHLLIECWWVLRWRAQFVLLCTKFPESSSQSGKICNQCHCWTWVLHCVCFFLPLINNHHSTTNHPILQVRLQGHALILSFRHPSENPKSINITNEVFIKKFHLFPEVQGLSWFNFSTLIPTLLLSSIAH